MWTSERFKNAVLVAALVLVVIAFGLMMLRNSGSSHAVPQRNTFGYRGR